MKKTAASVSWALFSVVVLAQERIPPEDAQKYAKIFVEQAAKVDNQQLRMELDTDKPFGLKKDNLGAMVIPDKKLSEEVIAKASKDLTPVGQLWFRNITPVVKDNPIPNDQLRIVTVTVNDKDHPLPLFLVGLRKQADGNLELVLYAKEKEPLLHLPLQKAEVNQELPIEMEAKGEGGKGELTLKVLGKYQAILPIARQEQ